MTVAEETSGGSIGTARIDVTVNTGTMQSGIDAAKRSVAGLGDQAAAQFERANASTKRYADSLLRQAELLGKTRAEQIAYNAQTRIGGELGDKIAAKALASQGKISSAIDGTAKSAKELQFAMRGLPAQVTDIFVGLASGQRPLTVLLQQGGQLKDMFGGIGPAAKALGSSLLSLINPYTILAAAAGGLFLAWKEGSDEADAYNKALAATGGYAGVTASQLSDMAKAMSRSIGTQHEAAAALAAVAGSGKFTGDQLELVARAALDMSRTTGQATAETIQQFERLKAEPLKAVLALNDAQHFLTLATYDRIKALQDEGREQEAATLAMRTYADATSHTSKAVVANLGDIERGWLAVKNAITGAGDALLSLGRQESDAEKIARLKASSDAASTKLQSLQNSGPQGTAFSLNLEGKAYYAGQLKLAQDAAAQALAAYKAEQAKQTAALQKVKEDATKSQLVQDKADSDGEVAEFATNAQKRATELAKVQGEYNQRIARALAAGNKKLADDLRASEQLVLAGVMNKYKDPKQPKDPEVSAYSTFKGQVDALDVKTITADNAALTQYQQGIRQLADEMAVYMQKGGDATKAAELFNRGQKDLAQTLVQSRRQEADAEKAYADALDKSNHALALQVNNEIASIGMGEKEYQRTQQLSEAYRDQAAALADLALKRQMGVDGKAGGISQSQYDADVKALQNATNQKVRILKDGYARMDEAQGDWANGARKAYQDWVDQASDVAGQTDQLFTNAFDGMADALANFATTGKLNFKGLSDSIIADLARMEARILVSQALQSIMGGGVNYAGGSGAASGTGQYSDFGSSGTLTTTYNAKGGVYGSASLSAYSGKVVDRPTMFAFAKGAGIMGEAGPEAIMPLRRGPDGRLGVASSGSSAADVQVEVNVTNNGQPVQARQTGVRQDGQKVIVDMMLDAVASDMASGGRTAKAAQQRFGLQRRGVPVSGG